MTSPVNHPDPPDPRQWFACAHPERPANEDTVYLGRCRACMLAAQATLTIQGESSGSLWEYGKFVQDGKLSEWVEIAIRQFHPDMHFSS